MTTARITARATTRKRTQQTSAPEQPDSANPAPANPAPRPRVGGGRELTAQSWKRTATASWRELATARRAGTRTDPRELDLIAIDPEDELVFVEVKRLAAED